MLSGGAAGPGGIARWNSTGWLVGFAPQARSAGRGETEPRDLATGLGRILRKYGHRGGHRVIQAITLFAGGLAGGGGHRLGAHLNLDVRTGLKVEAPGRMLRRSAF